MMKSFIYILLVLVVFSSCKTTKEVPVNYLQHASDTSGRILLNMPEPLIQKNDILSIRVFSLSLDPKTDIPYNLPDQVSSTSGTTTSAPSSGGILVDVNGNIDYPRVGTIHAAGLTRTQLAELMQQKLKDELKSPKVQVRFTNFKVTVLGEVKTPGSFTVPTERVTILEGLGLAGDITEYGNRQTVKVAREKDGAIELGIVDLTDNNLFTSPYFRLQQNDVVFVEQSGKRQKTEDTQTLTQRITLVTSVITAVAIILNIFK